MGIAIIDADTIVYASAGAAQKKDAETGELILEPVENAFSNAKNKMLQILKNTACNDYRAFLTASADKGSFRAIAYPDYKANRLGKERPVYYKEVREYLIRQWDAEVVETIEADDAVCMFQYECYQGSFGLDQSDNILETIIDASWPSILCGVDKDLDQIPGWHYNYNKEVLYYVKPLEALKAFYLQLLCGDTADNIPRVKKGWRQKNYEEALMSCSCESEMYELALKTTKELKEKDNPEEYLLWVGNLLHLRRYPDDCYKLPIIEAKDNADSK